MDLLWDTSWEAGEDMRLLDLYCGQGGAKRGYLMAGFTSVTGVDNAVTDAGSSVHEPYYGAEYVQADAIDYLRKHGREYDAVHASPPCQAYSRGTAAIDRSGYPDLIVATRDALEEVGIPYVIENVKDARSRLIEPAMLCGCMFGLSAVDDDGITLHMQRERWFETTFPMVAPKPCDHTGQEWIGGSYGGARRDKYDAKYVRKGGYVPSIPVQRRLLGIDWMTQQGMFLSLPPVYTHHIGKQLLK